MNKNERKLLEQLENKWKRHYVEDAPYLTEDEQKQLTLLREKRRLSLYPWTISRKDIAKMKKKITKKVFADFVFAQYDLDYIDSRADKNIVWIKGNMDAKVWKQLPLPPYNTNDLNAINEESGVFKFLLTSEAEKDLKNKNMGRPLTSYFDFLNDRKKLHLKKIGKYDKLIKKKKEELENLEKVRTVLVKNQNEIKKRIKKKSPSKKKK